MGERLRTLDWSRSPLGPPETWPQSLRTAASVMVNSLHPMFLAWGPELGFIYNDGYSRILGAKHPHALGRPFQEIWSEIWSDISPLVEAALSGEATWAEDMHLVMLRNGYPEDTWYTFSYSPVRDESGGVGGMFCACTETTGKVLMERRLKFQLAVSERLRPLTDPQAVKAAATALLGTELKAGRVGFAEVDASQNWALVESDWSAGELPSIAGRYRLDDFGPDLGRALRAGGVVSMSDVEREPESREIAQAYAALGVRAHIAAPLLKQGRLIAVLFVHNAEPRSWTDEEVFLTRELVERTWSSVQRARTEGRLRENEARLRLVQAAGRVGSFDWDMVTGRVFRSPEYLEIQGLAPDWDSLGVYSDDWLQRVHEEDREQVRAGFQADLAATGPFDREYRIVRPDTGETRWIHNRGRIDADEGGRPIRLLSVQTDVTERLQTEARQRLLINELNHRVKNTLATIQSIAAQTLRNANTLPQARSDFESRLLALSRAHDILTRQTWEGAALRDVVATAAESYGDGRVQAEGPDVVLPPAMALSFAMALHELGTNALKYGALSTPQGRVDIRWTLEDRTLALSWRESGGPPVSPPARRGFGSRLIEKNLARELNGEVAIDFAPSGVVCEIRAPLD